MPTRKIATVSGVLPPVTLAEAKAQCRVDCADEDTLIELFVDVATQAAADRLQRTLVPARYRLMLDFFPCEIGLLFPPIVSVESVKYIDSQGAQQTLSAQEYVFDGMSEPGRLVPAPGCKWPATLKGTNMVEVEFTAGYTAGQVPLPIKQWILLAVADLYDNRTRSADKPAVPQHFADGLLDTYRIWSL